MKFASSHKLAQDWNLIEYDFSKQKVKDTHNFGYDLPDFTNDSSKDLLAMRKDPRQIWYGLEPGWIVDLNDKVILKSTNEKLKEYYSS